MNINTIFEKVAEKIHTTTEEVYAEIQRAIDAGYDNPDPKVQAEWRKVKIKGNRPTPEEVINYAVSTLIVEQR